MPARTETAQHPSTEAKTSSETESKRIQALRQRLIEAGATGEMSFSAGNKDYPKSGVLAIRLIDSDEVSREQAVVVLANDLVRAYQSEGSLQPHDLSIVQISRDLNHKHYYLRNPNFRTSRTGPENLLEIDETSESITLRTMFGGGFLRSYHERIAWDPSLGED